MRVLVLISDRPAPPITASRVRNANLWPALARLGVEVRLLGLDQVRDSEAPVVAPGPCPLELYHFDREPFPVRAWHAATRSYHEWPVSATLHRRVREVVSEWRPDIVHAEELRMSAYLPSRSPEGPIRTVTLLNVESDLQRQTGSSPVRTGRRLINHLHWRSLRGFETRMLSAVDVAFAYSAADLARWRALLPATRWATTRTGVDVSGRTPAPQPAAPSVLLTGTLSYAPNVVGLFWFLDEVLPRLPADLPVTVAGSLAPPEVRRRLAQSRVRFVDTPGDLAPLYAEHALLAVPLFQGGGTRGKIPESLAYERLVLSTSKGAEGLDLGADQGVIIADDAAGFAAAIDRWASAPDERGALARRGREAVLRKYDWPVVARELHHAWVECAARPPGAVPPKRPSD
jgi:glycosyltransferase involved in cell wall biosynthesis